MNIGDIVKRITDIFDYNSEYKYGVIIMVYSLPEKRYSSGYILGPYPKLFAVKWNNIERVGEGFFEYGIEKI